MTGSLLRTVFAPRHLLAALMGGLTVAVPAALLITGFATLALAVAFGVDVAQAIFGRASLGRRAIRALRIPALATLALGTAYATNPWGQVTDYVLQGAQTLKSDPLTTGLRVQSFLASLDSGGVRLTFRQDHPGGTFDARTLAKLSAWAAETRSPALAEAGLDLDRTVPARRAAGGEIELVLLDTAEMSNPTLEGGFLMVSCLGTPAAGFSVEVLPEALLYGQDATSVPELKPLQEACLAAMNMPVQDFAGF